MLPRALVIQLRSYGPLIYAYTQALTKPQKKFFLHLRSGDIVLIPLVLLSISNAEEMYPASA